MIRHLLIEHQLLRLAETNEYGLVGCSKPHCDTPGVMFHADLPLQFLYHHLLTCRGASPGGMKLQFWHQSCLTLDVDVGHITTGVNGFTLCENKNIESFKNSSNKLPKLIKDLIIIGKFYNYELKEYDQYLWKVSNLNIYHGNLTAWTQMTWKSTGKVQIIEVPEDNVCSSSEKTLIAVPAKLNLEEARLVCENFGNGVIHVPNTEQ